jgi:isopenicillin-N N-acyltransferase-like protein
VLVRYLALAVLVWAAGRPGFSTLQPPKVLRSGRLERVGDTAVVYLQGTSYEMGVQQAMVLREPLRELVQAYLYGRLVLEKGAEHFWLLAQARLIEADVPRNLKQEMRGIADGAGLSYQDVLLLNTIPDLLALAHRSPSAALSPALFSPTPEGPVPSSPRAQSTAFAGWGDATEGGALLLAHNLEVDDSEWLRKYLVIAVRQPDNGNASVSVNLAGSVGVWAGMNEETIAVALASSPSVDVASAGGLPLPFLLRSALDSCGDLDAVSLLLLSAERLYGGNVIVADGKAPRAVAIELSAHRQAVFPGEPAGGLLVRTNHFLDPGLVPGQVGVLAEPEKHASEMRLITVLSWLETNRGWIGVDKALALLQEVGSGFGPNSESRTLQSLLFVPADAALWLAEGGIQAGSSVCPGGTDHRGVFVRLQFPALSLRGSRGALP